jgi:hypothetical protein
LRSKAYDASKVAYSAGDGGEAKTLSNKVRAHTCALLKSLPLAAVAALLLSLSTHLCLAAVAAMVLSVRASSLCIVICDCCLYIQHACTLLYLHMQYITLSTASTQTLCTLAAQQLYTFACPALL